MDREISTGRAGGLSSKRSGGAVAPKASPFVSRDLVDYNLPNPPPVKETLLSLSESGDKMLAWYEPSTHLSESGGNVTFWGNKDFHDYPGGTVQEGIGFTLSKRQAFTGSFGTENSIFVTSSLAGASGSYGLTQAMAQYVMPTTASFHFMCVIKPKALPASYKTPLYRRPIIVRQSNARMWLGVQPNGLNAMFMDSAFIQITASTQIPLTPGQTYIIDLYKYEDNENIFIANEDIKAQITASSNPWNSEISTNHLYYFGENAAIGEDLVFIHADIGDVIWFSGALSASTRQDIIDELKAKYGI